eukprot:14373639-Alexandrium_andersonii.AAC.1
MKQCSAVCRAVALSPRCPRELRRPPESPRELRRGGELDGEVWRVGIRTDLESLRRAPRGFQKAPGGAAEG